MLQPARAAADLLLEGAHPQFLVLSDAVDELGATGVDRLDEGVALRRHDRLEFLAVVLQGRGAENNYA